ncbi:MAG: succinate dehydrogenase cytochrome b subunit [Verrucomicrobiota bacterium JB023]|nr:succinate dehydrogenase cytochrome b subunit [Verrucomicrobiota bacterium JB023]
MTTLTRSLCAFWNSSIGKKIVVAVTGLIFIAFLAGHLIGNLLVFVGQEAFNEYAHWLHHLGHGGAIWAARIVLLGSLVLHVVATVSLTRANRAARPSYAKEDTIQASRSSRVMIWSGLTVLAFIIFHILHYTVRVDSQLAELGKEDPWKMVIVGFQNPAASIFYVIAMVLLCSHLAHGFSSAFQTLGLNSSKTRPTLQLIGKAYAVLICLGFISIPISILFFGYGN